MYKIIIALLSMLLLANNILAGQFEDKIGLEFSESECLDGNFTDSFHLDTVESDGSIEIRILTATNGLAEAINPKVRFQRNSISVSIETHHPKKIYSGCLCNKELTFKFQIPEAKYEHVYFIQDSNVYVHKRF